MAADKSRYGSATGFGVLFDFRFCKTPDSPPRLTSQRVEASISVAAPVFSNTVPIIPVSLNDEPNVLEYEIRLESMEHRLVHLKPQSAFPELAMQTSFEASHLLRKRATKAKLADFLFRCWRVLPANLGLSDSLAGCSRPPFTEITLTYLLSYFWRVLLAELGLAHLFTRFTRESMA